MPGEGEDIAAASPLARAGAFGVIGGEFSDRDVEKGRKRKRGGKEMVGDSPAGKTKRSPAPDKRKEKMRN